NLNLFHALSADDAEISALDILGSFAQKHDVERQLIRANLQIIEPVASLFCAYSFSPRFLAANQERLDVHVILRSKVSVRVSPVSRTTYLSETCRVDSRLVTSTVCASMTSPSQRCSEPRIVN